MKKYLLSIQTKKTLQKIGEILNIKNAHKKNYEELEKALLTFPYKKILNALKQTK